MELNQNEAEIISYALEEYYKSFPELNKLLLLSRFLLEESEIIIVIKDN